MRGNLRTMAIAAGTATTIITIGAIAGNIGPDVTCSRLGLFSSGSGDNFNYYGVDNGVRAFSMASTSCNEGDATAEWIDGAGGRNPVIAQNVFRLNNGRIEQIGQSWLKHSFCAVSEFTCGSCQSTGCNTLGIGCADTYGAGLNDGRSGGPKWKINPVGFGPGGVHDDTYNSSVGPSTIRGRLQIKDSDILAGGLFFAEVQYVTHDEPMENRWNNASYRPINLSLTSMSGAESGQASVRRGLPGIYAWQEHDPGVKIGTLDDPQQGRFFIAYKTTDNGDGTWTYEYAIQNLNSDLAGGTVSIEKAFDANILTTGFHDVDYHSGDGENYVTRDGTDWPATVNTNDVTWATTPFATNPNANSLEWGTLYNYRVTSDHEPVIGKITIGTFKDPNITMDLMVEVPGVGRSGLRRRHRQLRPLGQRR